MQINLPIAHLLEESQNVLIAGAGGGFDIYSGLPLFFHLRAMGKTVHLANYSFVPLNLAKRLTAAIEEIPTLLIGVHGAMRLKTQYFPEGYLAEWFLKEQGTEEIIWMLPDSGTDAIATAYKHLTQKLNIDTLILVDGGVDSIMRGDEEGPGTLLDDTISLVAIENLDLPRKILACIGFGTEVEERVCHYNALENIAGLVKAGAFYGSCSLTPQMDVFAPFESACRYAWEGAEGEEERAVSHISSRVIPAAHGEFGDYRMYDREKTARFISPLMSIYWFFDAQKVLERSVAADLVRGTVLKEDARSRLFQWMVLLPNKRPLRKIPY